MRARVHDPKPGAEHVHFGRQLRQWRRAAGLTQAELGHKLAYDHSFISRLERGHRWPTRELAARCDELFGTGGELVLLWGRADLERRMALVAWHPGDEDAFRLCTCALHRRDAAQGSNL